MVISASTRDAVERYRSYDAEDCDITVYVSPAKMNMAEFDAAKKHRQEKVKEANEKQDKFDADIWWKDNRAKFEQLDVGKCYEYLRNQEVRPTVQAKLNTLVYKLKGPPPKPPQPPTTNASGYVLMPCKPCSSRCNHKELCQYYSL